MRRLIFTLFGTAALTGLAQAEELKTEDKAALDLPVQTTLSGQYNMLAVVDEDPENDQYMVYGLKAKGQVFEGGSVFLGTGVRQLFSAESDETGVDLQDSQVGFAWKTKVPLGTDLDLGLSHELALFLPTSRASRAQDLYVAPQVKLGLGIEPVTGLTIGGGPRFRYRFHQYAERAGTYGNMNTQLDTGIGIAADYQPLDSEKYGRVAFGAGVGSDWFRKYNSREGYESEFSDQGVWFQQYGWSVHAGYGWNVFDFDVSLEQGGGVLRDGVVNTFLVHRDETQLAFTLSATL